MKDLNHLEFYKFYKTCDIDDDTTNILYVGKIHPNGDWLIQKVDQTDNIQIRYASYKNNTSYTDYASAWVARASLEYTTPDLL